MKRFVIEYANDKLKRLESEQKAAIMNASPESVLSVNDKFNAAMRVVTKAVFNCEYGYVGVDEAMKIISDPFGHIEEG